MTDKKDYFKIDYDTVLFNLPGDKRTVYLNYNTVQLCCSNCGSQCYIWTFEISSQKCFHWNLDITGNEFDATAREFEGREHKSTDYISGRWYCYGYQTDCGAVEVY